MGAIHIAYCRDCGEKVRSNRPLSDDYLCQECLVLDEKRPYESRVVRSPLPPPVAKRPLQIAEPLAVVSAPAPAPAPAPASVAVVKPVGKSSSARSPVKKTEPPVVENKTERRLFCKKIPVIGLNHAEFARWLVRHRYSRRDYFFVEVHCFSKVKETGIFVVLKEAKDRYDWPLINAFFTDSNPTLIVE